MDREKLVAGLVGRSEWAWRSYIEEHAKIVYAIAKELGMPRADADDLLQNTCVTALHAIQTLRDPSRLSSWTYSIAYRLAIDKLRKRREVSIEEAPEGAETEPQVEPSTSAVDELQRVEEAALLDDAMAQIDLRCRNLLKALYFEEPALGYAEVARRLKIPIGSIGPTRARCLGKLREKLKSLSNPPARPSTHREPDDRAPSARGRSRR